MSVVTFSRLRDSDDWGIRGSKEQPTDVPPEQGTMVTVTKKSGETQDVQMGRVIAQGDDWWLAAVGATNNAESRRIQDEDLLRQIQDLLREVVSLRHRIEALEEGSAIPTFSPAPDNDEGGADADPWA